MTPKDARAKIKEYKLQVRHSQWRGVTGTTHHIQLGYADQVGDFLMLSKGVGDSRGEATVNAIELFEERGISFIERHPNWREELAEIAIEEGKPLTIPFM